MGILSRRKYDDVEVDVDSLLANLHRLQAIDSSGLLKSEPRADLQDLTAALAARLGTKAQITLVTQDRQIVPNRAGAPVPRRGSEEEFLDYSYCKYVVAYKDVLSVTDSHTDDLVKDNLSTTINGVRSYLGTPFSYGGEVIGSLCVFHDQPRQWSDEDLAVLQDSAHQLMVAIDDDYQGPAPAGQHFRA